MPPSSKNSRLTNNAFDGVPHQVCYAVKANSNLGILKVLAEAGAGFDIVSGGELFRVLKAGGRSRQSHLLGRRENGHRARLCARARLKSFNCESEPELALIDSLAARRGVKANIAMRVNPDVDASTHPYISTGLKKHKFGIDISRSRRSVPARAELSKI